MVKIRENGEERMGKEIKQQIIMFQSQKVNLNFILIAKLHDHCTHQISKRN